MDDLRFVWDPRKAKENERKHGVAFVEAQTVFLDDYALLIADPDHSEDEDRFVIRMISARKADRTERRQYAERSGR